MGAAARFRSICQYPKFCSRSAGVDDLNRFPTTMAGYSGTPLWKKLGYRPGLVACVESAPPGYVQMLDLPADAAPAWSPSITGDTKLVHVFVVRRSVLATRLKSLRKAIPSECAVWVSWPKKSSGVATDITEDTIREVALPLGFVDIKVCAVDATWSGLKLVIRSELRRPAPRGGSAKFEE